jgi:hypothetical protein
VPIPGRAPDEHVDGAIVIAVLERREAQALERLCFDVDDALPDLLTLRE